MSASKFYRRITELKEDMLGYTMKTKPNYGYCKIEARNDKCRINITIHDLKPQTQHVYKVNLIKVLEHEIKMITLGVLEIDDANCGTLKITTKTNHVMETDHTIEEFGVVAVFLISPEDPTIGVITPLVGFINEEVNWKNSIHLNTLDSSVVSNSQEEKEEPVSNTKPSHSDKEQEVKKQVNKKIDKEEVKEIHKEKDEELSKKIRKEQIESEEAIEVKDISDQTFDIIKSHFDKKELKEIYDNIFREYPSMSPFENKFKSHVFIRIEPSDIIYLPIQTWMFTNNPFLLNGYRKYKHLLLGREKEQLTDEYYFILGVPAIFYPKDKVAAYIYGFKKFVCCKEVKPKAGEYGYWIVEISCTV